MLLGLKVSQLRQALQCVCLLALPLVLSISRIWYAEVSSQNHCLLVRVVSEIATTAHAVVAAFTYETFKPRQTETKLNFIPDVVKSLAVLLRGDLQKGLAIDLVGFCKVQANGRALPRPHREEAGLAKALPFFADLQLLVLVHELNDPTLNQKNRRVVQFVLIENLLAWAELNRLDS